MKQKIGNILRCIIIYIVPVGIFFYLFKKIPKTDVLKEFARADVRIIGITLVISFVSNLLFASLRWKMILGIIGYQIPYREILTLKMGTEPIVGILPVKSGEILRMLYLKRKYGVGFDDSLFSVGMNYILNFVTLCFFSLMGVVFCFFRVGPTISGTENVFWVGIFGGMRSGKMTEWRQRFIRKIDEKFYFQKHIGNLKNIVFNGGIVFLSLAMWFSELLNVFLLSVSLGHPIPLLLLWMIIPAIIIVSHAPVSISGVGIREFLVLIWLAPYASPEALVSLGILYSLVEKIFPMAVGGIFSGHYLRMIFDKKQNENGFETKKD